MNKFNKYFLMNEKENLNILIIKIRLAMKLEMEI